MHAIKVSSRTSFPGAPHSRRSLSSFCSPRPTGRELRRAQAVRGTSSDLIDDMFFSNEFARSMNEIEAFHQQLQLQMDRELQFAKERGLLSTPTPPGAASFHEEESFRSARPDEFTSYYRYESIVIYGGRTVPCIAAPPSAEAATGGSWAALVVVAAAASAAVGAVLARRFESMCYREESKAQIVLLWPLLALFSPKFRAQLRRVFKREGLGEEGDRRRGDTRSAEMLSAPDPDSTKSQRQP